MNSSSDSVIEELLDNLRAQHQKERAAQRQATRQTQEEERLRAIRIANTIRSGRSGAAEMMLTLAAQYAQLRRQKAQHTLLETTRQRSAIFGHLEALELESNNQRTEETP